MRPGKRLYLLATGTGFAPFGSIIRDPEVYDRFEEVVVVYGCRTVAELAFGSRTVLEVRNSEHLGPVAHDKLKLYTTVTREPHVRQARVTTLLESGAVTRDLGLPDLDPVHDRVMICGSPEMLRDLRNLLAARGFLEGSNSEPGDFVIERAFVER
jgi:ferredoxin--NADP+ reductase